MKRIELHWYDNNPISVLLLPLAWCFCLATDLRRWLYRHGWLKSVVLPVPVIVVGNITVGGSGKTPLVVWLVEMLSGQGMRPGVVSRGYGGKAPYWPQVVSGQSDPSLVGDEPVLIARRTGCPVVVGADRVVAAQQLLADYGVDIIIADDGLQHYRLARTLEIAVIDGRRKLGNGHCLPAGPLRERRGRLRHVDLRVSTELSGVGTYLMRLEPGDVHAVNDKARIHSLRHFSRQVVHAVAAIGHPQRFFALLRECGIEIREHPFRDHHRFTAEDICFDDDLPVLMTEKDAIKCTTFADSRHWYLPVTARLNNEFGEHLLARLRSRLTEVSGR